MILDFNLSRFARRCDISGISGTRACGGIFRKYLVFRQNPPRSPKISSEFSPCVNKSTYCMYSTKTTTTTMTEAALYVHAYVYMRGLCELIARISVLCYRGESSCHATRRYHGPERDLYLHRCDITVVALKVTVMTPVHFGPAIRMVLTFLPPRGERLVRPGMYSVEAETGTSGLGVTEPPFLPHHYHHPPLSPSSFCSTIIRSPLYGRPKLPPPPSPMLRDRSHELRGGSIVFA